MRIGSGLESQRRACFRDAGHNRLDLEALKDEGWKRTRRRSNRLAGPGRLPGLGGPIIRFSAELLGVDRLVRNWLAATEQFLRSDFEVQVDDDTLVPTARRNDDTRSSTMPKRSTTHAKTPPWPHRPGNLAHRARLHVAAASDAYGPADREESVATVRAAIDTGDFYGMGPNEMLLGEALKGIQRDYQLSVKSGALRDPGRNFVGVDGRPRAVRNFRAYSLQRLGVDHVDIYRPARLDPDVPFGHRRRDRRMREGGVGSPHRPLRGGGRRRSAARPRSTRSGTSRSSTRSSLAVSKPRSCRPAANSASASRPTASFPAA